MGYAVAPARERGLKLLRLLKSKLILRRSREGAWIEIRRNFRNHAVPRRRSREGAWIEIDVLDFYWPSFAVAPAMERGLKYLCRIITLSP